MVAMPTVSVRSSRASLISRSSCRRALGVRTEISSCATGPGIASRSTQGRSAYGAPACGDPECGAPESVRTEVIAPNATTGSSYPPSSGPHSATPAPLPPCPPPSPSPPACLAGNVPARPAYDLSFTRPACHPSFTGPAGYPSLIRPARHPSLTGPVHAAGQQVPQPELDLAGVHPRDGLLELGQHLSLPDPRPSPAALARLTRITVRRFASSHAAHATGRRRTLTPVCEEKCHCPTELRENFVAPASGSLVGLSLWPDAVAAAGEMVRLRRRWRNCLDLPRSGPHRRRSLRSAGGT